MLQVALMAKCKECIGIEKGDTPSKYAEVRNQYENYIIAYM